MGACKAAAKGFSDREREARLGQDSGLLPGCRFPPRNGVPCPAAHMATSVQAKARLSLECPQCEPTCITSSSPNLMYDTITLR